MHIATIIVPDPDATNDFDAIVDGLDLYVAVTDDDDVPGLAVADHLLYGPRGEKWMDFGDGLELYPVFPKKLVLP